MKFDIASRNENLPVSKRFVFKVLEAGEKYYSPEENKKGTIKLSPEVAKAITEDLINKPIIIGHKIITTDTIDDQAQIVVGRIIRAFVNTEGFKTADNYFIEPDNATYVEGLVDKQTGLDYINKGYLPSIYYSITEEKKLSSNKIEVLGATSNHLGLVENPKYDTSIYNYNFNNKQMQIMTKNGTAIANGTYEEPQNENCAMNSAEDMGEYPIENLYVKDEEGNEYSVAEIWAEIKDDVANESKQYYDKPEITIEGKVYNVKNLLSKYKSKKVANSETEPQADAEPKPEKTEDENGVKNSALKQDVTNSQPKQESFMNKALGLFGTAKETTLILGGTYKQ